MKVKSIYFMLIILLLAGVLGYYAIGFSTSRTEGVFSIYLVDNVDLQKAMTMDINKIPLERVPVLTEGDFIAYDWDEHIIKLKTDPEVSDRLAQKIDNAQKLIQPFVLVCNHERIYVGTFVSLLSSYLPTCPSISVGPNPDSLKIKQFSEVKEINDKRIYNALKKAGKLD